MRLGVAVLAPALEETPLGDGWRKGSFLSAGNKGGAVDGVTRTVTKNRWQQRDIDHGSSIGCCPTTAMVPVVLDHRGHEGQPRASTDQGKK